MILKNPFPSYAQYNEDIILLALLSDVDNGFYVDIGANYPTIDSVTKLFYKHGWRGINVEPIPSFFELLQKDRPEDINLNIGIGDKNGELDFFENQIVPGHSSFDLDNAIDSKTDAINKYKVKIKTLKYVFDSNQVKKIHFLKVDVEGFENAVIKSNDWSKYRPEVICIEASDKKTTWQRILIKNRYKFFINDGLNEYYVAEESWARTDKFAEKVIGLAHQSLKHHQYDAWSRDVNQLKKVTQLNQTHFNMVQELRHDNHMLRHYNRLSLSNVGYLKRLKRSFYGLTLDWVRYKLDNKKRRR